MIVFTLLGFVLNLSLVFSSNDLEIQPSSSPNNRTSKFFFFFPDPSFVRVVATACTGDNGLSGICYSRNQCSTMTGTASGTCGNTGCCCVFIKTCASWTRTNCTYFQSPNYPAPYTGGAPCTITVKKCAKDVCQLRLDFVNFNLAPPDANGNSVDDFLLVTGGASVVPKISGSNSGQHVYVDFAGDNPIQLTVDTNILLAFNRTWNIKITQVKCCDRAPVGCLMDYTATAGKVMSFNYGMLASTAIDPLIPGPGTRELANLNYGVCVEMAPGYCSIEWSQNPNDLYSFTVTGDTEGLDNTVLGTPIASVTGENCTTDYIIIPNPSVNMMPVPYDRFCGNGIPVVTSSSKPFVLTVVTNENELLGPPPDVGNRGFCLNYRQLPCMMR